MQKVKSLSEQFREHMELIRSTRSAAYSRRIRRYNMFRIAETRFIANVVAETA